MKTRLTVLDGWRGISILSVLVGHLVPLSGKPANLNSMVAQFGMSIFFILSGFLIVSILLKTGDVRSFLIHRLCRILPLAWLFLIVMLLIDHASIAAWTANMLFYANLPPFYLDYHNGHFWSLCVEMQFYMAIAAAVALLGRRGLWLVPIVAVIVTGLRVYNNTHTDIITWFRVDEIMAGGILALLRHRLPVVRAPWLVWLVPAMAALLMFSSHPDSGRINCFQGYIAAAMIGITLLVPHPTTNRLLSLRLLGYLAAISYALYVLHPIATGWFQYDDLLTKYAVRVPVLIGIFALAHLSTFYYEWPWQQFGRWLAESPARPRVM